MRVLVVNRDASVGGGSSYIKNLNVGLRSCGVETSVLAAPGPMGRAHRKTAGRFVPLPLVHPLQARMLASLAKRLRADLIQVHSFTQAEVALRAAEIADLPLVWTVHGFIGPERVPKYAPLLQRADAIVVMNERLQEFYGEVVGEGRVMLSRLPLLVPQSVSMRRTAERFGYCSRLSGNKAPRAEAWIRAMASRDELCARRIEVLGGGKRAGRLRAIASQLDLAVKWRPRVPDFSRVAGEYDVVAGAGYVALEAMAAGATVVGMGFEGCFGAVTIDRLDRGFSVNFGDQTWHPLPSDSEFIARELSHAMEARESGDSTAVTLRVRELCDSAAIAAQVTRLFGALISKADFRPAELSRTCCREEAENPSFAQEGLHSERPV